MDDKTAQLLKRISKNIRELRLAKGLTQQDMTEFGYDARWYQRLESGRHVPTLPTLLKLAKTFKIDVSKFFE